MKPLKEALMERRAETVPPGYLLALSFARANGYATIGGQFSKDINEAITAGLVHCKKFTIKTPRGLYPTPHYKRIK